MKVMYDNIITTDKILESRVNIIFENRFGKFKKHPGLKLCKELVDNNIFDFLTGDRLNKIKQLWWLYTNLITVKYHNIPEYNMYIEIQKM